jgi:hypothetical protein
MSLAAVPFIVIPGLVPGIHVFVFVDGRVEPGHDEGSGTA